MNAILLFIVLIGLVMMCGKKKEMFGYDETTRQIVLDDPSFDIKEYTKISDIKLNHDLMEKLVLATNKYVSEKTGICTYVIETLSIEKYIHNENNSEIYRCMFMLMKQHGFAFGFSVSVDIKLIPGGTVEVLSARSQPINVTPPTTILPYNNNVEGHEYVDYELIKMSELKLIKNNRNT